MAAIQTLRNKGSLLIIIIGVALFAFIIGEYLSSRGQASASAGADVAVINGKGVSIELFQNIITEKEELTKMQSGVSTLDEQTVTDIRQRAWSEMIQELVMSREVEKLGLTVSGDELYNLISGDNPHPFVMQFFSDPNTGVLNRIALNQFLQQINSSEEENSQKLFWLYLEDLIYKEQISNKYNTLLSKGIYATNLEANKRKAELNTSASFNYIVKRYSEISDTAITITDADIKAYYKANKTQYQQETSRDIRYIVWEVMPSAKDYATTEKWINDIKAEYKSVEANNSDQYTKANSDITPNGANYAKGELEASLDSFAFASNLGDIYGPFFEGDFYKIAKLSKIDYLSDSVKASHILLEVNQENGYQVNQFADSLKTLIENGASISKLAIEHSADQGTAQLGGDLGWIKEGQMVKPFSDSCFYSKTGDVKLVYSQYGIHIVKVIAQSRKVKKVQVNILARKVRASEETDQGYFAKSSEFGAINNTPEKFNAAIAEGNLTAIPYLNLKDDVTSFTGLNQSRELVRWSFNNDEGDISSRVMEFDNKYVIAIIDKVREEGFIPVEDIKTIIELEVRKEKKAELLITSMAKAQEDASDLNTIGANLNVAVNNASNVRFSSYSIPNLGSEPELQAAAITLEEGEISTPIAGTNGVYLIQIESKNSPEATDFNTIEKNYINRANSSRVNYSSLTVLNDLAGVEDNRIIFPNL